MIMLFGPFGTPLEVQIRTSEMHKIAEAGVASHWLYKTFDTSLSDLQKKTHQWLQSLLQMQSESGDSAEFLEHVDGDPLAELDEAQKEVFGADKIVIEPVGFLTREGEHLLRPGRKIVHGFFAHIDN